MKSEECASKSSTLAGTLSLPLCSFHRTQRRWQHQFVEFSLQECLPRKWGSGGESKAQHQHCIKQVESPVAPSSKKPGLRKHFLGSGVCPTNCPFEIGAMTRQGKTLSLVESATLQCQLLPLALAVPPTRSLGQPCVELLLNFVQNQNAPTQQQLQSHRAGVTRKDVPPEGHRHTPPALHSE